MGGSGGAAAAGSGGVATSGSGGAPAGSGSGGMMSGGGGVQAGAGSGGMSGGGAGGVAGGAAGAGGQAAGGGVGVGMQADPGSVGDGKTTENAPYNEPPEVTGLLNGAPAGLLNGLPPSMQGATTPLLYASPAKYPGYKFHYWIWVPSQYQPGKPAALMVFQDGPHYLGITDSHFHTPTVFANLINSGEMPVTIALFTEAGTPTGNFDFNSQRLIREKEYSEYSDVFASFLLTELIPNVLSNKYDLVKDADGWAIGGQSSGGNCALIVGMHESTKFHKILTHNGAFDNADLQTSDYMNNAKPVFPNVINDSAVLPLRVNLLSGPNDIPITYQYNQSVIAALMAKGYHYRYTEGSGMHYPPLHAVSDYPAALRWLWRGYTLPWYK
ncbi:MAG TPA: alpha/beta hydrolase-fold protein [Polyangiaceae bacterium]|nr:alpha/beta hydrolase-fold protein [Polyangiaceae bacterium]